MGMTGRCGATSWGGSKYFRLMETPGILRDLDEWIRHRLRLVQLKQWKRGTTVFRELRARGVFKHAMAALFAAHWWRVSSHPTLQIALPTSYYDRIGVPRLAG